MKSNKKVDNILLNYNHCVVVLIVSLFSLVFYMCLLVTPPLIQCLIEILYCGLLSHYF